MSFSHQPEKDYYAVLGVAKDATPKKIKRAYYNKLLANHPDQHRDDKEAEEKTKAINEAYETLSDPKKRAAYDNVGGASVSAAAAPSYSAVNVNDDAEDDQAIYVSSREFFHLVRSLKRLPQSPWEKYLRTDEQRAEFAEYERGEDAKLDSEFAKVRAEREARESVHKASKDPASDKEGVFIYINNYVVAGGYNQNPDPKKLQDLKEIIKVINHYQKFPIARSQLMIISQFPGYADVITHSLSSDSKRREDRCFILKVKASAVEGALTLADVIWVKPFSSGHVMNNFDAKDEKALTPFHQPASTKAQLQASIVALVEGCNVLLDQKKYKETKGAILSRLQNIKAQVDEYLKDDGQTSTFIDFAVKRLNNGTDLFGSGMENEIKVALKIVSLWVKGNIDQIDLNGKDFTDKERALLNKGELAATIQRLLAKPSVAHKA